MFIRFTILALLMLPATMQAQAVAYGASVPAGMGTPISLGIACSAANASATASSIFDDRANSGNSFWKCRLGANGTTYGWFGPYTAPTLTGASANGSGQVVFSLSDGTTITSTGSLQGPIGLTGSAGSQGAIGQTGQAGPAGNTGSQGIAGNNGSNGTNGTNAANPSFTVSASSLAAGASPTATLSGTYPNLAIAYGIPAGQPGSAGAVGQTGNTGPAGSVGGIGPQGASGATLVGTCTVTQTATVSIGLGPRTVASTCTGVVSGGYYLLAETASSLTANPSYGLFAGATGTAANTLQVTLYAPLLAVGASYTITFVAYKIG